MPIQPIMGSMARILAVSDVEMSSVYSERIRERFGGADFAVGCGDLPYFYLEYIISTLDIPLYFVHGNHDSKAEAGEGEDRSGPWGGVNLHARVLRDEKTGLLLAGLEGVIRYNRGRFQYTQAEMWQMALPLAARIKLAELRWRRKLDLFVSHAAPWGAGDRPDRAHVGVKAFRWLDERFQPRAHLHGHIHLNASTDPREAAIGRTRVINVYGAQEISLD